MARRRDRPDASDPVVLLGTADARLRATLAARLSRAGGRDRAERPRGGRPRFRVLPAASPAVMRRTCTASVSAVALDLALRPGSALDLVRALRDGHPEVPILAFARGAAASEAIAAVMAGADFFHDCSEAGCAGFERALERAIDRRRLIALIERNEAQVAEARGRLAQLSGDLVRAVPGFRPIHAREDVLPFREAARRYLLAAAQLFEGDAGGLAKALGVSYFALRRLLARYDVPSPAARTRKHGTPGRWRGSTGGVI